MPGVVEVVGMQNLKQIQESVMFEDEKNKKYNAAEVDLSPNLDDLDPETRKAVEKALKTAEEGKAPKARGQPYIPSGLMANLVMAWGC